jgi:hypothetical protein
MFYIPSCNFSVVPFLVAAPSEEWLCGPSLAEILGSNSAMAWMSVCCECCVVLGRALFDEMITRPEE